MNGHSQLASCLHLGDGIGRQGIFRVLADIDISTQLCTAALVHDVGGDFSISDNSCILLAGVDGSAVSGNRRINYHTSTNVSIDLDSSEQTLKANAGRGAGNSLSVKNDAVGMDQGEERHSGQKNRRVEHDKRDVLKRERRESRPGLANEMKETKQKDRQDPELRAIFEAKK